MYAIVEIAGQQFKVESGRKLYTNRLKGDEGASLSFDRVLLTDNDGQVNVGSPVVEGAKVEAKIVRHLKDEKVIVFKKKRRKGYKVKNGHRQFLTQIEITNIIA
jgi:large subunit ribosomal protein L21